VTRRARGVALLGAAAACAGLAASAVSRYTNDVRAQVGPLVPVVVAAQDVPPGRLITPQVAAASFERRHVPERYVPREAIRDLNSIIGNHAAVAIRTGDYVGGSNLSSAGRAGEGERSRGGRVVELSVAGAGSFADALRPGVRVDVLITTDRRSYLALQNAELVSFAGGGAEGKAIASLRVSLRQAVLITAAESFARELRLVPRPEGDRARLGPVAVSASELGR
jgi:pilus assembly protein CpaB